MVFQLSGWDIQPLDVAGQVTLMQGLPLLLGILVRRGLPRLADRLERPLDQLVNGLLLVLEAVILFVYRKRLGGFLAGNLLGLACIALLVLVTLTIRWLLADTELRERTTVAMVTSGHNPGLALLFASITPPW